VIKQITTEEMRALLDQLPPMSAPTRRLLLTGQASFKAADGNEYQAPTTESDDGSPTHFAAGVMFKTERDPNKCN
jgi:hypothetical protein